MEGWDRRLPLGEAWARWVPACCQALREIVDEIEAFPLGNEPIRMARQKLLEARLLLEFTLTDSLLFEVSHPVFDDRARAEGRPYDVREGIAGDQDG